MAVDLHMHTTASDGTYPPREVVAMCADRGQKIIAISDHDTTGAIEEATDEATKRGLRVVPAIEINTDTKPLDPKVRKKFLEVHILGYFIEYQQPWFQRKLESLRAGRSDRIGHMLEKLAAAGIDMERSQVEKFAHGDSIGRPHVALALVEKGHARDVNDAFDRYLTVGKPGYAPRPKFEPEEAIAAITAAVGVPVLAHPGLVGDDTLIFRLVAAGLKGLEVWHPSHDAPTRRRYVDLAKHHRIGITGGSDFHGSKIHAGAEPGCVNFSMAQFEAFCALNGRDCLAVWLAPRKDREAFKDALAQLKARGARLVTLSSLPDLSGETILNYHFEVDGQLTPLTTRTYQRCAESLYSVFAGADVVEREINHLFGVKFVGNPNLPNMTSER